MLGMATPLRAAAAPETSDLVIETASGAHGFRVEVASTPDERARGLMYRKELAKDAGMLFLYPQKQRISMWMKNTYLSLDMLFVAPDGTILTIAERTIPFSTNVISSRLRVMGVLEVIAGTVDRLGIKVGDKIRHKALGNWKE